MQLDKKLTGNGGYMMNVAGLAVVEDYNGDVPSALTTGRAVQDWADELQDVEGRVEVSIQNLEMSETGDTHKALVAKVPETDVACVLAPVIPEDDGGEA